MLTKLKSQLELLNIVSHLKRQGKRIVFARGCFDILHPGHIDYLKKAKYLGDILVVWVNTDKSVKRLKGEKRPLFSAQHRLRVLASLEVVDFVCLFDDQQGLEIVAKFKPNIVAADKISSNFQQMIQAYGGKVKLIPLLKQYSTSKMINQILKDYV